MIQEHAEIECPHCGEWLEVLIDPSVSWQVYVEDCQVCCRPIEIHVDFGQGQVRVRAEATD
ncbi:MAG: CPXCG motif-containing cysteine-rich protein [Acidobacteria bacterium]|nr:CPXCG motif-containing cysteine-rich protein [Acidobacteriota bacterium]